MESILIKYFEGSDEMKICFSRKMGIDFDRVIKQCLHLSALPFPIKASNSSQSVFLCDFILGFENSRIVMFALANLIYFDLDRFM